MKNSSNEMMIKKTKGDKNHEKINFDDLFFNCRCFAVH